VTKSRGIIKEEHVARMDKRKYAYRVLVGKDEGKRSLVRTRRRRENNIKMDLQEVGWGMDLLTWLKLGTSGGLLCKEPSVFIKFREFLD
jgi:hypothetical protein